MQSHTITNYASLIINHLLFTALALNSCPNARSLFSTVAIETIPERRHTIGHSQLSQMIKGAERGPAHFQLSRKCRSPVTQLHPRYQGEKYSYCRSTSPNNEAYIACAIEIDVDSPDDIPFGRDVHVCACSLCTYRQTNSENRAS